MIVTPKSIIALVLAGLVALLGFFSTAHAQVEWTILYRWFFSNNVDNVDHCFTTTNATPGSGYVYEGSPFYVATTQMRDTVPLRQWWNSNVIDHCLTTGESTPGSGYVCQGILGYVATTEIPNTTPLYHWWNSKTNDNLYTTDPTGEVAPVSEPGPYVYEDIACYVWAGLPPVASFTYSPENPVVGEEIIFDASSTYDPDGEVVNYEWDFDVSDGKQMDTEGEIVSHNYSEAGEYTVVLTVTDNHGMTDSAIPKVLAVIPVHYNLTIHSSAGGSVTAPGEGTLTYDDSTAVNLTAEADEGYQFVSWTGDVDTIIDVNSATTTITMNDNYSITANFEEVPPLPTGCFVATAAYGTPMVEEIQTLREFRDEYLLTNPLGQGLVDVYYRISPPIADFVTEHPGLKPIVRAGLMPVVAMCSIVFDIGPQFTGNEA